MEIKLAVAINFFSKYSNEECTMHTKRDSIEIMIGKEAEKPLKNFLIFFYRDIKKDQNNQ